MKTYKILLVIGIFMIALVVWSCNEVAPTVQATPYVVQVTPLPQIVGLGDRMELVRYFEYTFDITEWQHVSSKDSVFGISDDVGLEFRNDPVVFAKLSISLEGDVQIGSQRIIDFLSKLLEKAAYSKAMELLPNGGETLIHDYHISIYRDRALGKAIIEIEWRGDM